MKIAEAEVLEAELQRIRDDNADLRRRVAEISALEAAAKRAEARAELLEEKVRLTLHMLLNFLSLRPS